jgi:WD repeat-containing protein 70
MMAIMPRSFGNQGKKNNLAASFAKTKRGVSTFEISSEL